MVNNFGKFCRKLRIDKNELLYDMAAKLGVSSAFLSKVENGKKKPPQEWRNLLIEKYDLEGQKIRELDKCIFEAQNYNSIDMSGWKEDDRMMMLSFARKFSNLDKDILRQFLEEEDGN
ncbi:helix-turn-helix domain-containing protein [Blautia schinkii]|nr:helix-turn-helix domain-containing protein [Blautia schinkii]